MRLTYFAYFAALICLAGTIYRLGRWLVLPLGPESRETTPPRRGIGAARAVLAAVIHPRRLGLVLRAFFLEVAGQGQILRQSPLRWVMHMALSVGILALLLLHTFDDYTLARFFSDYASTLNPYMPLRNLLGLLVLAGVIVALARRRRDAAIRGTTRRGDRLLLWLLAAIVVSGAVLEATQIISPNLFDQMVVDYMGSDDPEEIAPLKAYWAEYFDVAFTPPPEADATVLAEGARLHADSCASCHARPASAVMAYPLARALKPLAAPMARIELENWLWYAHYLISCLALALLPFTKLFHLLSAPISLMVRALGPAATDAAVNRPARRAMGLDACTHCGECSRHCSVAPIFQVIANRDILPSEKLSGVARLAAGRTSPRAAMALAEGSFICTACGRCTQWCPSGIDLQDLWDASKKDLRRAGFPDPHGWIRQHAAPQWAEILTAHIAPAAARPAVCLTDNPNTFWACVQCSTCTNVCPVVAVSADPQRDLEMTPQQVMNLMRLQLKEAAMGARMVWDCVTCYKCQEHCPQGVRVADVLYELRNEACRRLTYAAERRAAAPDQTENLLPGSSEDKSGA
jgi:heterodisulfide reductase subunit C